MDIYGYLWIMMDHDGLDVRIPSNYHSSEIYR